MNKDQVAGRLQQAKGKAKQVAGEAVGNDSLRARGTAEKVAGRAQAGVGDTKEKVKDVIDKA